MTDKIREQIERIAYVGAQGKQPNIYAEAADTMEKMLAVVEAARKFFETTSDPMDEIENIRDAIAELDKDNDV